MRLNDRNAVPQPDYVAPFLTSVEARENNYYYFLPVKVNLIWAD